MDAVQQPVAAASTDQAPAGAWADLPRLYRDLAWIWPWWSRPDGDYRTYCHHVLELLSSAGVRHGGSMLVLACGGGTNVSHLKECFAVTGVDLSAEMLALARATNPGCEFVQGDMRTVALERRFDAVFIDDGIGYLVSREDLLAVFRNARKHLRPGGAVIFTADALKETFEQNATTVWPVVETAGEHPAEVTIVENQYDPDPNDDTFETMMLFLIREGGRLRVEQDRHVLGLFSRAIWQEVLREAGFLVREVPYRENDRGYTSFVGVAPTD
ncbi:class I SAM-dependent DNA methyltransferase [Opitutus terrae]|uniref:Methyltransferase type 11 n=1 Tax=Opitutus terrae (strain DSM 11246 / JCM 15787 / PB90-1) TaxID=452637 RepID=B1ZSJ6_OPITP|nr:class I SAM-dependent methyltransferase [Opitutus terrae]ACB73853.1 Methyltransferase type 11 [Opitutus terrae PB90-1]